MHRLVMLTLTLCVGGILGAQNPPSPPFLPPPPVMPTCLGPCPPAFWVLEVFPEIGPPVNKVQGSNSLDTLAFVHARCNNGLPSGHAYAEDAWPGWNHIGGSTNGTVVCVLSLVGGTPCIHDNAWIQAASRPYTWLDANLNPPAGFTAAPSLNEIFSVCTGANNGISVEATYALGGNSLTGSVILGVSGESLIPGLGVQLGLTSSASIGGLPEDRGFVATRKADSKQSDWELWTYEGSIYLSALADGWHAGLFFNYASAEVTVAGSTHNTLVRFVAPACTSLVSSPTPYGGVTNGGFGATGTTPRLPPGTTPPLSPSGPGPLGPGDTLPFGHKGFAWLYPVTGGVVVPGEAQAH